MTEIEVYQTVPDYIEEDFNSILYVDDEESNLRVFDSVFSRYYNIYTANNGSTAIEMLNEHDIHMIITDQKMPEMTGTDLLEQTLEDFPDIIRIILTGFADIQAIIKAINKCSIYKYITKPYENAEIKEIIDKGLNIYNIRQEKYLQEQSQEAQQVVETTPAVATGTSSHLANDLVLTDESFESYFDFHIDYELKKDNEHRSVWGDFFIHADEDGTCLFFLTMKTPPNELGTACYMHAKSKLRTILEATGNAIKLPQLQQELLSVYEQHELEGPENIKILSYHWETKKLHYFSQELHIKLYAFGDKLEPVKFKKKGLKDGYNLYQASVEGDLMVYFWDFALSEDATEEAPGYFSQIVTHATSVPFDLQENQIESGIKSVSQHFEDVVLYGIYIND